jgi:hypothetical protein
MGNPSASTPRSPRHRVARALEHGAAAAGAKHVRPGFARTAEDDLAFALGFPYLSYLVDDAADEPAKDAPALAHDVVFGRYPVELPRRIALARARVLPVVVLSASAAVDPANAFRNADVVYGLVARTDDLTVDEASAIVDKAILDRSLTGANIVPTLSALEALVGPSALAEILVSAIERLTDEQRTTLPKSGMFARWLGFSLLRVSVPEAAALRARMEALVARLPAGTGGRVPVHGSLELVLRGSGATTSDDAIHLVDAAPEAIRAIVLTEGVQPRFAPNARLLFLGGLAQLAHFTQHASKLNPAKQPDLVQELGPIQHDDVLDFLLLLAGASKAKQEAIAWFVDHAAETRSFLDARRASDGDASKWARAVLAKLPS